jgi:hypothetical protein
MTANLCAACWSRCPELSPLRQIRDGTEPQQYAGSRKIIPKVFKIGNGERSPAQLDTAADSGVAALLAVLAAPNKRPCVAVGVTKHAKITTLARRSRPTTDEVLCTRSKKETGGGGGASIFASDVDC